MTKKNQAKYIIALAVMATIIIFRSSYIAIYGNDTPFWDQWDLLRNTLAPWQSGVLPVADLFKPHNEHRILFTRLISMALLASNNGIWSNLREAYVNTAIYAAVLVYFYWLASKGIEGKVRHAALIVGIVAIGSLPFDWENNLVGFQNQFYLMAAIAIAMVGVAAQGKMSLGSCVLLLVLGVASLLTTAGGALSTVVVIAVLLLRSLANQYSVRYLLAVSASMGVLLVVGILLVPAIPAHEVLKAQGLKEHLLAMATMLIWPWQPLTKHHVFLIPLIWMPSILWLVRFSMKRKADAGELFAVGMLGWTLLQAAAFAHARGHGALEIPSRYMNIVSIGLLGNLTLALRLIDQHSWSHIFSATQRSIKTIIVVAWIGIMATALAARTNGDVAVMQQRAAFNQVETFFTARYLQTGDQAFLRHTSLMIPYPSSDALIDYLKDPATRKMLAISERSHRRPSETPFEVVATHLLHLQPITTRLLPRSQLDELASPQTLGKCDFSFNFISPRPEVKILSAKQNDPIIFNGWLINPLAPERKNFALVLKGEKNYYLNAIPGNAREDVVRAFHSLRSQSLGFFAPGVLNDIEPGNYSVIITTPGPAGQLICTPDPAVRLIVLAADSKLSGDGL
jgi:hypothetical protein